MNAAELQLALKRLLVTGSALYVAAHPDDENTAMLAYLENEKLVRTGYLSLTRGDGGQNLIGSEKGALLGVLRTQELLAARRIDGAQQFFTRAIDFGFSKSPEETLRLWDREKVLSDVVWIIRRYRPDIIITRFPTTGEGGHGHHTASAILAGEAFRAAADATKFPEQLKYVSVWQPKRLFWNAFNFQNPTAAPPDSLHMDLGDYNPLLGESYTEIAAQSRSQHKSQGFGSAQRRGSSVNYLKLLAGDAASKDAFEGIDLSWRRIKGGESVAAPLEEANRNFDPQHPDKILPPLVRAYRAMNELPAETQKENSELITTKRRELLDTIRACAGLWMEAITKDATAAPGEIVEGNISIVKRSALPMSVKAITFPPDNIVYEEPEVGDLVTNQPMNMPIETILPENLNSVPYSQPYWLRDEPEGNLYSVKDRWLVGTPENAPALPIKVSIEIEGQTVVFDLPAVYRYVDRVRGEVYRPFAITPPMTVNLDSGVYVFADSNPKQVQTVVRSWAKDKQQGALLMFDLPKEWKFDGGSHIELNKKGDEITEQFIISPQSVESSTTKAGAFVGTTKEMSDGMVRSFVHTFYSRGYIQIDYPHIPTQLLFPPAEAKLVRVDLQKRGRRIGYVMGAGDDVPEALRQVGYDVVLLSDRDLEEADLKSFDAIVTGVRAFNTRARLRQNEKRLLDYVAQGGTLVAQYNTAGEDLGAQPGPFPFKLSSERVTDETARVDFNPQHPLLNFPNKITEDDFKGWVQERGLNFPNSWDARYETPLASHDPNETDKRGGLLYARYGKGAYIYTSYAFFRQLPAGVPGAYRLFVNMVSAGKEK